MYCVCVQYTGESPGGDSLCIVSVEVILCVHTGGDSLCIVSVTLCTYQEVILCVLCLSTPGGDSLCIVSDYTRR